MATLKRKYWFTDYQMPNEDMASGTVTFGSYLLAENQEEAEQLIQTRGLGETLSSKGHEISSDGVRREIWTYPQVLLGRTRWNTPHQSQDVERVLHMCMWLIHLGEVSHRFRHPEPLFHDTGALHQLLHLMTMSHVTGKQSVFRLCDDLVNATPEMFLTPEEKLELLEPTDWVEERDYVNTWTT